MNLHKQFLKLAKEKNKITYQLLSILPKIYELGIYKKYTRTIQGYAMQFAQIPESTVNKVLKLDQKLVDKPLLKKAIAQVGIHKVAIVESITTSENEAIIVEKLQSMSKSSLEQLSKELRTSNNPKHKSLTLDLSPEMQQLWNTALKRLNLTDLSDTKALQIILETVLTTNPKPEFTTKTLSKKQKNKVFKKYSNKCAHPNCNKNAENIHHKDRYAKTKTHENLVPLCKVHHEFAHNNLIQNESLEPHFWQIQLSQTNCFIDKKYQHYKNCTVP